LALTLGEPAGIGPDIAIAAWRRRVELSLPPFYLIGDTAFLAGRAERLGLSLPMRSVAPGEAAGVLRLRPNPAAPTPRARRPRSRRSAARSPT
jgi:4-hydroxythreonine-4-phosphate dehydrogenase